MHKNSLLTKVKCSSLLLFLVAQLSVPTTTSAMISSESSGSYKISTPQSMESIYRSRYLLQTETLATVTPEVGELILPKGITGGAVFLVDASSGKPEGFSYRATTETIEAPFAVKIGAKNEKSVVDKNTTTSVTLPIKPGDTLPQYSDIELVFQEPVSLTGVKLSFDALSQTPQTVTVKGLDTTQGSEQVIFINQLSYQPLLRFPSQRITKLLITLAYSQTLRLTEVGVVQSDVTTNLEQERIRFLIKPKTNYVLYFNRDPQQPTVHQPLEVGDLFSKKDVVQVTTPPIESNPFYKPADKDSDGILDAQDNCAAISNSDQIDRNMNGVGDACDDFDEDNILNAQDNCPETANLAQVDTDGDGIGDVCDDAESRLTEQNPWLPWAAMGLSGLVIAGLFVSVIRSKKFSPVAPIPRQRQNT